MMKTIECIASSLAMFVLVCPVGVAQFRDGSQIHVSSACRVTQSGFDTLRYHYLLKILPDSPQHLVTYSVELGLASSDDQHSIRIDSTTSRNWGGSIVFPTACPSLFRGAEISWVTLDTMTCLADQFVQPVSAISPGDSLIVTLSSQGLPCIARYWAGGWFVPYSESEYDSLLGLGYSDFTIVKPWYNDAYSGFTLAPRFLHSSLAPLRLLDTLSEWISQSHSLGWITNQQIADKYFNYFSSARSQVHDGRGTEAIRILRTVLRNADSDSSSMLTSEAYALIRYNTEYLVGKLKEGQK